MHSRAGAVVEVPTSIAGNDLDVAIGISLVLPVLPPAAEKSPSSRSR